VTDEKIGKKDLIHDLIFKLFESFLSDDESIIGDEIDF
jgi:hypothetical protein